MTNSLIAEGVTVKIKPQIRILLFPCSYMHIIIDDNERNIVAQNPTNIDNFHIRNHLRNWRAVNFVSETSKLLSTSKTLLTFFFRMNIHHLLSLTLALRA